MSTEVEPVKEGGENLYIHKLPGRTSYGNITLKFGITNSLDLWNWYAKVIAGHAIRKNATIVQYDWQGQPARRWNLREAYPVKWVGPSFKSDSSQMGIETLELAHHGFEVK